MPRAAAVARANLFKDRSSPVHDLLNDLVQRCSVALEGGADFPSIWSSIISGHELVVGPPVQHLRNGRAELRVPLLRNRFLVFTSEAPRFSIL